MKFRRSRLRLYILAAIFLCFSAQGVSQEGEKIGSWYVYNGFFNFSPKIELFAETQIRTWEPVGNIQTFFVRPFFNYNVNEKFQIGISPEYHVSWSFAESANDKNKTEEYRTTLQGMLDQKLGRVALQHRYRYEFRFLDESGKQRTRYRLQLGIPISRKVIDKGVWFATLGNEIMLNTQPKFDISQNRTYGMLGYQLSKSTSLQIGYMYISRPEEENLHRLQFFLTQKLNFFD